MNATAIARVSDCPGVREFRDGTGVRTYLNVAEERFVLLREPGFAELDGLVVEFKARLHRAVVAYLSRTDGFARADGERAHTYLFATTRTNAGRPNSPPKLCHEFVSPTALREALAEDGLPVPKDGIPEYIAGLRSLPLERQRRLAERILGSDLDTLVSRLGSAGRTRLAEVRTINAARAEAHDPVDFLHRIAGFALQYIAASDRARGVRRAGRRGDTDSYDVATVLLLLAWLRRHGILLFPAQHLDARLFGVYSLSWSAAMRVADVMSLYLNDAEAELYGYLHAELEAGKSFAQARPLDRKGKGGRPRKAANDASEARTAFGEAPAGEDGDSGNGAAGERQAYAKGAGLSTMRSLLVNVFLKSNMERIGPVLRDVLEAYCEKLLDRGATRFQSLNLLSDAFRVIQNRYHDAVGAEPLVATKRRVAKARSGYLFPWVKDPDARRPRLLLGYTDDPRVAYWADVMDEAIRADAGTSNRQGVNNLRSHINHFLRFVWMTPDFPADILRVDASRHINDRRSPEASGCLRAYIARSDLKVSVKNQALHTLSLMFRAYIKLKGLHVDNPIDFSADKFKIDKRRSNTPRPYIGRSHLTAIKDLNAAKDFALSRSLQNHTRRVWDPDRKQWVHVWWPGVAILFDFLLSVPLRSFSRFVDSGEGDEFLVDPIAVDDTIPNTAPWAERGRREGVLYVERPGRTDDDEEDDEEDDDPRDDAHAGGDGDGEPDGKAPLAPFIGLYINTNKTGIDENGGFKIPWCPDNVRDNLVRLIEWQRKFNPIQQPIPCLERGTYETLKKAGQDLTIEARTKSFPLFRDPANDDNWPVSKAVIDAYWGELLWAYQQTLGTSKKRQRRFAHLVEKNGRPAKEALIDIHTLRVSGISSLIEKGVPPDIVQQVVGHYTLVMTLYYSKQRHSRINRILRKKIAESKFDPASIEHLADAADFEDLLQWLVNNRADEDAVGVGMYRERFGRGDGSVHVMEHGICPGGHCDTGGEFIASANAHGPVPPFACPLCRYRLTGPMFLVGLVHNANRLIFQYRRVAEEIARVNAELQAIAEAHPDEDAPELDATAEMLYRQSEPLILQWFAERRYAEVAKAMMSDYLDAAPGRGTLPALVTGLASGEIEVAIEERPAFVLLQDLVEGAAILPGVRAHIGDVIQDHREFLNRVLAASDLEPFLLRLPPGPAQEEAARVLGAAIVDLLRRDDDLVAVSEGRLKLGAADPLIAKLANEMADQVRATKAVDIQALLTLPRIAEKAERILAGPRPEGPVDGEVLTPAG